MSLSEKVIEEVCERYLRERDRYRKLTRVVEESCIKHFIEDSALMVNVTARTKSPASLRKKLQRIARKEEKAHWNTADDVFRELSDLSAVRIAYYSSANAESIERDLKELFHCPLGFDRKDKHRDGASSHQYYKATHCQVAVRDERLIGDNDNLGGLACEIQICSMMEHVWNEIEHDIGYKPQGDLSEVEKLRLKELGNLTREGDRIINGLIESHEHRIAQQERIEDEGALASFIGEVFQIGRITFRDNIGNLFEILQRLEINGRKELRLAMGFSRRRDADNDEPRRLWKEARAELVRFNKFLARKGQDSYQLRDRNSADPALILILKHGHARILKQLPAGRGMGRPAKVRSLATRYMEFVARTRG